MSKQGLQRFASGIIVATVVMTAAYYFSANDLKTTAETESNQQETTAPLTEENVQAYLKDHNMIAIKQETYNRLNTEEQETPEEKETNNEQEDQEKVVRYTLSIESGATGSAVANDLVEARIIEDNQALINYLEDHELVPYIQIGEYELTNDMSIATIANKITKK